MIATDIHWSGVHEGLVLDRLLLYPEVHVFDKDQRFRAYATHGFNGNRSKGMVAVQAHVLDLLSPLSCSIYRTSSDR